MELEQGLWSNTSAGAVVGALRVCFASKGDCTDIEPVFEAHNFFRLTPLWCLFLPVRYLARNGNVFWSDLDSYIVF